MCNRLKAEWSKNGRQRSALVGEWSKCGRRMVEEWSTTVDRWSKNGRQWSQNRRSMVDNGCIMVAAWSKTDRCRVGNDRRMAEEWSSMVDHDRHRGHNNISAWVPACLDAKVRGASVLQCGPLLRRACRIVFVLAQPVRFVNLVCVSQRRCILLCTVFVPCGSVLPVIARVCPFGSSGLCVSILDVHLMLWSVQLHPHMCALPVGICKANLV